MKIISIISISVLLFTGCSTVDTVQKTESTVASQSQSSGLKQKIGQMLMVGFFGTSAKPGSQICQDIQNYNLGGVILFDFNPTNKSQAKNIVNKQQLAQLTRELQNCSLHKNLLIAVDQEGGRVQRLKSKYGFYGNFPKASDLVHQSDAEISNVYNRMGRELHEAGINFNLAPVVDLAINPNNVVINKLGRSFGKDPATVAHYATLFSNAMHKNNVLTSLKHFPGHGSSLGDTHKGFVDVTNDWQVTELDPYKILIGSSRIDTIMVAHVFNANLDPKYPASLSAKTINGKLRRDMGYNGVVITDDLQMNAIDKKYGLKATLRLSINAGDDILLFGNQLNQNNTLSTRKLVGMIAIMVQQGEININKIDQAYGRIQRLKRKHF